MSKLNKYRTGAPLYPSSGYSSPKHKVLKPVLIEVVKRKPNPNSPDEMQKTLNKVRKNNYKGLTGTP